MNSDREAHFLDGRFKLLPPEHLGGAMERSLVTKGAVGDVAAHPLVPPSPWSLTSEKSPISVDLLCT